MVIYPMREHDYDLVGDVNGQEIKSIFKNLKGGTAVGVDGIPILLFKNLLSILMPIIVLLCNKVLRSGQWPSAWKTSLFMPLFKRGNPKAHENYRLIALVPALKNRWAPKVSLRTQKLSLLLFADDIALVANKPQDLQTLLNLIEKS
ncbi:hypothetical protein QYM36_004282 [Artemia franciscana]|uniref:Reverse transcriptase domain-containing protein n=1 Tax=Artemia franciscana TaxID=6661 RepID=A0AA88L7Z9_ARTSF|nr:hypothetical protein QYM36_004282 [Artemia franciscana]